MSRYQRSMRDALQSVADGQMEFDEAVKWEVKITGLPTFYADGKSKGDVRRTLRKLLKRPDEIVSIERVTPSELKKIRRGQIQGDEPGDDEEEVKEELLLEDNRVTKVQNKELSIDDIVNMIQFGKPFTVGEDIPATLPPGDPNFPRYKDIPNSVVDKEDKKANKVKAKIEKDTLVPTKTQEATQLKKESKARQVEATKVWTDRAQAKDKKDQNKDPVGKQHEGIVSGAGKVAGAAIGGAAGLAFGKGIGLGTGAAIIKGTSAIQKNLDKKKAARKAERERVKAAGEGRQKEEVEINDAYNSILDQQIAKQKADDAKKSDEKWRKNFRRQSNIRVGAMKRRQQAQSDSPGQRVEVAPPGFGHTVAKKEVTRPNKPKSKVGGTAHEFDKDLKSGKFKGLPGDKTMKDKKASMFKIMWSQHNKGDKPHYKPGVKDKLKAKYKKEENLLDTTKRYLSD